MVEVYKEFLVFPSDYSKKIAFLSTKDVTKSWALDVDWSFPLSDAKPKMFLESGIEEQKIQEAENQETGLSIHQVAVSEALNLLAFTTNDKSLFLCKIEDSSAVVLSRRCFLRAASVIRFSKCGKLLFLSDKTGDTLEYSCEEVKQPGRWILGHISQILDLKVHDQLSFIVTSDRDEKVRVTNYPATHEIEAFCVGHKEFVTSVAFLNDDLLISASGDKTIRLWSYKNGKQLHVTNLEFVPIIIVLSKTEAAAGFIAVTSDDNSIYIYSYSIVDSNAMKIRLIKQKKYPGDFDVTVKDSTFFLKYQEETDSKQKLRIDKFDAGSESPSFELLCDVTDAMNISLDPSFKIFKSFDVSILFKKRFDNAKQYVDRKKARIESKVSKKNAKKAKKK